MISVFIDTNIYLRFYDSKEGAFKKLLKSVEEISSSIFFSPQIRDEIDRNKQNLFLGSFKGYMDGTSMTQVKLPDHISSGLDKEIAEWTKRRTEAEDATKKEKNNLKQIKDKMLLEISNGQDDIEKVLSKIPQKHTSIPDEIYNRARNRKERGNPPGKRTDPIGDQINWEMLLDHIKEAIPAHLIIASNDDDFFASSDGLLVLNTLLEKEIRRINSKIKIFCYKTLAETLKKYDELKPMKTLPEKEELSTITENEKLSGRYIPGILMLHGTLNTNFDPTNPLRYVQCPACQLVSVMNIRTIKLVKGAIQHEYQCPNCLSTFDSPF